MEEWIEKLEQIRNNYQVIGNSYVIPIYELDCLISDMKANPVENRVSQPSEPTCENCKHEEFSDKAGSLCKKHNQWLNEMFPNTDLTLSDIGCRQFEQK